MICYRKFPEVLDLSLPPDNPVGTEFSELLRRASTGDREAQEVICLRYEQQVRIIVRVLLGPQLRQHVDSMDLMQSVHHCMLQGLQNNQFQISSPEKLVALASTMARNKIARKWRTHRRQVSTLLTDEQDGTMRNLSGEIRAGSEECPTDISDYHELIQEVCQRLNETEHIMLRMRLDGFSNQEVAEELGLHPVALRVRWTRLKQRMQASPFLKDWLD
jgi:RNA polymerase sigma factor (sigma-70 family)